MDMGFTDLWGIDLDEARRDLRPLGWSELCARLAAAQDLRRAVSAQRLAAAPGGGRGASFHRSAARLLQAAVNPAENAEYEDRINLYHSGIGKGGGRTFMNTPNSVSRPSPVSLSRREKP
ncbi:hypothetical protein OLX02_05865 [Novosphingobium sp. KCTC 2891]|uniref:hypothetical protein n=1 Tax=Novosphingobium sp. KCTC 2891 TaxID=2989730 RepID=UPI002221BC75|nr:hypothetical protein [Novosphingobium sp. KCTC 2891]MCW1382343.1 hypothetical protein [Novosphingobium sp. KCTC 2891]